MGYVFAPKNTPPAPLLCRPPCDSVNILAKFIEIYQEAKNSHSAESVMPAMEKAFNALKDTTEKQKAQ